MAYVYSGACNTALEGVQVTAIRVCLPPYPSFSSFLRLDFGFPGECTPYAQKGLGGQFNTST
jgi:hypothetical protein